MFNEINNIKIEIQQMKEAYLKSIEEQKQRDKIKDENLANMKKEIEELRNEIKEIRQNDISNLKDQIQEENKNIQKTIQDLTASTEEQINHQKQEEQNHFNTIHEEIENIKQDILKKADNQDLIDTKKDLQIQQGKDQQEKSIIRDELLQLKQIVNKINNFIILLDTNSKSFGTNWKVTEYLHKNGMFNSDEFLNQINQFSEFNIEIKYPSDNFESIYEGALKLKKSHKSKLTISIFLTSPSNKYFKENKEINSVIFDSTITEIEEESFCVCSSLSNISIPSSVTCIGESTFEGC